MNSDMQAKGREGCDVVLHDGYDGLGRVTDTTLGNSDIPKDDIEDVYGTSPMQTGLLFSQAKEESLYQFFVVHKVEATSMFDSVDAQRLSEAWQQVVQRHSSLRTIFVRGVSGDSAFTQVVLKRVAPSIAHVRCSADTLAALLRDRANIPVQGASPPHKFTIFESENKVYIRMDINHALVDGYSMVVIIRDLLAAYEGQVQPARATPYRHFIDYVQASDWNVGLRYWGDYLRDIAPCHFPMLNDGGTSEGRFQTVEVDHRIALKSMSAFCRKHGITLSTLFKAVWALVLGAYSGSDDVCFGYLISGRDIPVNNVDDIVGAFINILVCRVRLADDLKDILGSIQADSLAALEHQHCSLTDVRRSLETNLGGRTLFNTAVNLQTRPGSDAAESHQIALSVEHVHDPTEFSVAVDIAIVGGQDVEISLAYRTEHVSQGQAIHLAEAFRTALGRVLDSTSRLPGTDMDLVGPNHLEQLWSWNANLPPMVDRCLHDLIANQARIRPAAPAVASWDASLTYGELVEMSNKLAVHLSHLGVRPGVIVSLCFDKSAWAVVAILAVLTAGGAFVLLDPKHVSADRTRAVINDTRARLLVADSTLLGDMVDSVVLVGRQELKNIDSCASCRKDPAVRHKPRPDDTAYVIMTSGRYTSVANSAEDTFANQLHRLAGTTGTPKGSITTHSAFASSAAAHGKIGRMSSSSRVLQYASFSFDACLVEILTPLMFGACVCIPSEQARLDNITAAIDNLAVTWAVLTPSVARLITPPKVPTLKTLVMAGEAMSRSDMEQWKGYATLHNGYGPSECSVACAWNDDVRGDPATIGRSIGGVCWVVDARDAERLMPIGAIGELVVEGFTVAQGYLNNPEKTAEVFIKPPQWLLSRRSGADTPSRLYKTGDLVRYNSDGTLNFISRKDTQVKIHGQRIEVGEIEHHVMSRSSETMADVLVDVVKPAARRQQQTLVAFFTPADAPSCPSKSPDEGSDFLELSQKMERQLQSLQDGLTDVLPPYMIPSAFLPVTFLPKSAAGKLDRKSLRERAERLSADALSKYSLLTTGRKEPTTEAERKLQQAWSQTLGTPITAIRGNTSFFRVGGDSLGAMKLVFAARELGLGLSVSDVFGNPTLSAMANKAQPLQPSLPTARPSIAPFSLLRRGVSVEALVATAAEQCCIDKTRIVDLYPCTPLQEGMMTLSMQNLGGYIRQNIFRLPPTLSVARLREAWEKVVACNPILRTRIVNSEEAGMLQAVVGGAAEWVERNGSLQEYLKTDGHLEITWGAPLCTHAILETPEGDTFFIWTIHHCLFDGWSHGLVMAQLEQAYHGRPLQDLTPFNVFIDFLANRDEKSCIDFWKAQMEGSTPSTLPQLPAVGYTPKVDHVTQRVVTMTGADADLGVMPSTILRAAWALTMARYTDAEDVVFGSTLSGRSSSARDITQINGPTIATVPIRVPVDRGQTVADFLKRIQDQATKTAPFEHWGVQRITQLNKNAKFQNLFVVQPGSDAEGVLGLEEMTPSSEPDFSTYPLLVECFLRGEGRVDVRMLYDAAEVAYAPQLAVLFEQTVGQLLAHSGNRDATLGSLTLCSPEDKAQILSWNREDPAIVNRCIHDLISSRAVMAPNASAVCSWDFNLSYAELDSMATTLACHLVALGVAPETIVPALFEKSPWSVVAQIATLKAGGAICMLDPSESKARLESTVDTVQAGLILTSDLHGQTLDPTPGRTFFVLNHTTMQRLSNSISPNHRRTLPWVDPRTAAYVVFTHHDGTAGKLTGGAVTEHRAFASQSASLAPAMQIDASSRILQYSAYSSALFALETFTALIEGGCVCIAKDEARAQPSDLVDVIGSLGVTWALLTPSVARLLPRNRVPSLKTLVLGGEAMAHTDKAWSESVTLMNAYWPSEYSLPSVLSPRVTLDSKPLTIGRDVSGRCWIVEPDNHDVLAPVACTGELLIESPGLARGYWKEPQKSAAVFIGSPAWLRDLRPVSRLYKTGDLVRYDPVTGDIHFVGRKDRRVKLHGRIIALGDIEHQITASSGSTGSVAVTLPMAGVFEGKLVATLTLRSLSASRPVGGAELELVDIPAEVTTVRQQLREVSGYLETRLPPEMVPSLWAVVHAIPLTRSLKVDRPKVSTWLEDMSDELVRQVVNVSNHDDEPVMCEEASTTMETRLLGLVAMVLNVPVDQVPGNKSFIGLGGDSITAMQLVARCRTQNITIKVREILQSKTLVALAEQCVAAAGTAAKDVQKVDEEASGTAFPLTPIQRLYFEAGLGPTRDVAGAAPASLPGESRHFNQSTLVQLKRRVTVGQLQSAMYAIVKQHGMLRARFSQINGTWMQEIRPCGADSFIFTHHRLLSSSAMVPIMAASQRSLDAEHGAVFSVDFLEVMDPSQQLVFLAAHHLVVDLVSWRVLLQDLEEFINSGALFSKTPLSFRTWTKAQEKYALERLRPERIAATFHLPPSEFSYWGVDVASNTFGDVVGSSFSLDAATTAALLGGVCHERFGTEPTDLFIAALQHSFATVFTDRGVAPVFCEGHGREAWDGDMDLSSTVGWFTTLYPLHSAGASLLLDTIQRTKDARRRVADNGWSYMCSRFLTTEGRTTLANHGPMEILFNYMGLQQQLERHEGLLQEVPLTGPADGSLGPAADVGQRCPRLAMFDVSVGVTKGQAVFSILYNRYALHSDKIREWAREYQRSLEAVVRQLSSTMSLPKPSDFPLLKLDNDDLERIRTHVLPSLGCTGFGDVEDMYSLAPTQKGIIMSQAKSGAVYRDRFVYSLSSRNPSRPVDLQRLAAAWQKVVSLHASLRTVILDDLSAEESFGQLVLSTWSPRVCRLECADDDALAEMQRVATADFPRREPAHCVVLCQTEKRVYLQLDISHALIDGSSMGILLYQLLAAYDGKLPPNEGDDDAPRYRDYVAHIKSMQAEESMAYWTQHLEGVLPCHVPALREGTPPANVHEVESISVDFAAQSNRMARFCRSQGLTPSNVFQLAWALVLRLYTGVDRVAFGYLTSGRDAPVHRIDEIVGAVCNMLVFKIDFANSTSVLELLQEAQTAWANGLPHQFTPLFDIQHRQGTSGQALFNTCMSYRPEARMDDSIVADASIALDFISGHDPSEFDVTLNIGASRTGPFEAQFNYRAAHMTAAQAENMAYALRRAVDCTLDLADKGSPLTRGCLFGEATFRRSPAFPPVPTLSTIFPPVVRLADHIIAAQAQAQPLGPAVCAWDGELTHAELDHHSTQLAGHLVARYGVGPDVFVPVCMEKSVWYVVCVLAVMKAGAAFVPMDASQPGRFRTIIEQTGARLVLTSAAQAEPMSQLAETAMVVDAAALHPLPPSSSSRPPPYRHRDPSNACYVIFTSGTTGVAKGVVIEHRNLCSSAVGHKAAWGLNAQTRMLHFSSVGFDASIGEILATLMAGGCVCVPSEDERMNDLEAAMRRMKVNVGFFTPSFVKVLSPENIPGVHTMILAGETTPERELKRWAHRVRLILVYGPTECTVVSSSITAPVDLKPSNIGAPNASLYWVVDGADHNTLLPAGGIGELLIEGPILGRGYLRQPAKTAAAFITDPAWASREANQVRRFYKTGDLVQLNLDGTYRYLGRRDTQVKIRGQRIELGEVEHHFKSCLNGNYTVAAEVLKTDTQVVLVGFIALGNEYDGEQPGASPISERTQRRLEEIVAGAAAKMARSVPGFMVPSVFVPLRTIPLLASCKTDRKQLRAIAAALRPSDIATLSATNFTAAAAVPPTSTRNQSGLGQVEDRMRDLWGEVLGMDAKAIAPGAEFFSQGGDSVLAIKLAAACRAAGLVVSVADLLRNPTLESLCESLVSEDAKEDGEEDTPKKAYEPFSTLGPLNSIAFIEGVICPQIKATAANIEDIVEATTSQSQFVTSGLLQGRGDTNYFVFQLRGECDAAALEAACRGLVAKHAILRTIFVASKRRVFQVVLRNVVPKFTTYQCVKWRQKHLAAKLVKSDQAQHVALGQPFLQYMFLTDGAKQSLLVMRISHAQYDGMSLPILIDDLGALYDGRALPLSRPAFTEFAHGARESNDVGGAEDYWCKLLAGSKMTNIVSHKSPAYQDTKRRTVARKMPMPRTQSLGSMTFANVAKAAWALVLAEVSSSTDVVFGHLVSGRNMSLGRDTNINEILGPCINLVPVRVRLGPKNACTTAQEVLEQVRDQQLAAIPYETFGFDRIVERCTDWPLWTRFSSIVQHQNLEGVGVQNFFEEAFPFGAGVDARLAAIPGKQDTTDVLVRSTPEKGGESVQIALHFSPLVIPPEMAQHMLDRLLGNISLLAAAHTTSTPTSTLTITSTTPTATATTSTTGMSSTSSIDLTEHIESWQSAPPCIPILALNAQTLDLAGNIIPDPSKGDRTAAAIKAGLRFERNIPPVIRSLVRMVWEYVLERDSADDHDPVDPNATCWYNVWGNLIAAAQMAEFFTEKLGGASGRVGGGGPKPKGGFQLVTMEDMIDHPTMLAQAMLVAERLGLTIIPEAEPTEVGVKTRKTARTTKTVVLVRGSGREKGGEKGPRRKDKKESNKKKLASSDGKLSLLTIGTFGRSFFGKDGEKTCRQQVWVTEVGALDEKMAM